jgi:hypothetical protein
VGGVCHARVAQLKNITGPQSHSNGSRVSMGGDCVRVEVGEYEADVRGRCGWRGFVQI